MRFQNVMLSFLGLQSAFASNEYEIEDANVLHDAQGRDLAASSYKNAEFSVSEVNGALNIINKLRRQVALKQRAADLIEVKVNWNLTTALQRFVALGGADWGYLDSEFPKPPGYNHQTNFHQLKNNATFMNITKEYTGLHKLLLESDLAIGHDTFKPAPGKALQIVRLRANQGPCFVYKNCVNKAPLTYDNYVPCSFYPDPYNLKSTPKQCWWFFWYYPRMVHARAKEFAFVKLHRPGRFVVERAQTDAWLFVFVLNGIKPHLDNIPYQIGGACTKCPPEFPGCNNGLCVAVPTQFPTAAPSLAPTETPTKTPTNAPAKAPTLRAG